MNIPFLTLFCAGTFACTLHNMSTMFVLLTSLRLTQPSTSFGRRISNTIIDPYFNRFCLRFVRQISEPPATPSVEGRVSSSSIIVVSERKHRYVIFTTHK